MLVRVRLFIHGDSPRSARALQQISAFRKDRGEDVVELEVVDVLADAMQAEQQKVLATPTLMRVLPLPVMRIVGDLGDPAALEKLLTPPAPFLM